MGIRGSLMQVMRALLVACIAGMGPPLPAATPTAQPIDIPGEDLGTALLAFAAVTHQQIAFDYKLVARYKSTAVSGTYTAPEGLRALIGAAPFLIRATPSGVLTVAAKPAVPVVRDASAATGQSSIPSQNISPASAAPPPEVTVSARRARLQPRVFQFVARVSARDAGGGLARWQVPVCPNVTGLSKDEGEYVLLRISEIARAAGVPLAYEDCRRPNLFVWVTPDPKKLLEAMHRERREATFGDADPKVVDAFIAADRPAKVWYDSLVETADDARPIYGSMNGMVAQLSTGGGQLTNGRGAVPPTDTKGANTNDFERASRVTRAMVWAFSEVYIVVDAGRLPGITRRQFADYIAMVGLAEINPGAQLGDAPTILKLFDGAPQTALPAMSEWDQAFLRSLYAVDQTIKVQQGEIALDMVRDLVH